MKKDTKRVLFFVPPGGVGPYDGCGADSQENEANGWCILRGRFAKHLCQ